MSHFRDHVDHQRILARLAAFVDILEFSDKHGDDVRDTRKTIWRAILRMGLAPQPDLLDLIQKDDSIEIYSASEERVIFPALAHFQGEKQTFEMSAIGVFSKEPTRETWLALLKVKFGWLSTKWRMTWRESDVTISPLKKNGRAFAAARIAHRVHHVGA